MKAKWTAKLLSVLIILTLFAGHACAMQIQNHITSFNVHRTSVNPISKSAKKLSSGYRTNRAGDDAAGLGISEKMRAQLLGLSAAARQKVNGVSMVQTAEGALQEVHSMLQRMAELCVQSASGTAASSESASEPEQPELAIDQTQTGTDSAASSLFSAVLDQHTMITGCIDENNVMAVITISEEDGFVFEQTATAGGDIVFMNTNPQAVLIGPKGEIGIVGRGEAWVEAYSGDGDLLSGWKLYSDGESVTADSDGQQDLFIAVDGKHVESLVLTEGTTQQLAVITAAPAAEPAALELKINTENNRNFLLQLAQTLLSAQ